MAPFGKSLAREREARGISLEDISGYTKIGVRMLKAIEAERFDQLPGGIFNTSYVRQYARYLGLDEEQATSEYLQAVASVQEASIPQSPS